MIIYVMAIIVLDYITGVSKSYYNRKLSSYRSIKGIAKKVGECCLLGLVFILDEVMQTGGTLFKGYSYLLIANEGLSILENLGSMNVAVPKFIKNRLEDVEKEMK